MIEVFIFIVVFISAAVLLVSINQFYTYYYDFYHWVQKHICRETILYAEPVEGLPYEAEPFVTVYRGRDNTYRWDHLKIGNIIFLDENKLDYFGTYLYRLDSSAGRAAD